MQTERGLYARICEGISTRESRAFYLNTDKAAFDFLMLCNGYDRSPKDKDFSVDNERLKHINRAHRSTGVVFAGPSLSSNFFGSYAQPPDNFISAFSRPAPKNTINQIKRTNINQAARVAFLFGVLIRDAEKMTEQMADRVELEAQITALGKPKSYEAIAAATAMFLLSNAASPTQAWFEEDVAKMSEAIVDDPIKIKRTLDLGFSQAIRLQTFLGGGNRVEDPVSNIEASVKDMKDFPTVGAEFHLPVTEQKPGFWERLALLNMSQYHHGSYVQFSRNDRGVIEIRMNPSISPVASANYNLIKLLVPEIGKAYFTTTLNRDGEDFNWASENNKELLHNLHALGLLGYATHFENVSTADRAEIPLGGAYLGQTVKYTEGNYNFTGAWNGGIGEHGQVGIYTGYGNTFPFFSYYLSMALANPSVFDRIGDLSKIKTPEDALGVSPQKRIGVFQEIRKTVMETQWMRTAHEAGGKILDSLSY